MRVTADEQLTSLGDLIFSGPFELGLLAIPVTIFTTAGVISAIKMNDGLEGLSGGLSVISWVLLSMAALSAAESAWLRLSQILIVSLLAFLAFNYRSIWKKTALVYQSDAGSTLLGFITAWLLIASAQGNKAFIALVNAHWFLAVPLILSA